MTSPDGPGHLTTDELFRQHAGFVARFLSRLGVAADQLEDALQEVFLVVHRNGGYRPGLAKPTSYLANLAIRAAAKHRRRDGVARLRHSDAAPEQLSGELEDPARALQTRQDLERLQRALQRLPEELCTTLLLVEMEGESCVSVAAGLGCPVGTIYWRLHRARNQLRAALRAVDGPRRGPQSVSEPLDERAQPARSWMILFGLDGFDRSETSRLLQLARDQPAPISLGAQLARHHELIRAGAELPLWAGGVAAHSASWLSVLGAGTIAGAAVAVGAVTAATVLMLQAPASLAREPREPREPSESARASAEIAKTVHIPAPPEPEQGAREKAALATGAPVTQAPRPPRRAHARSTEAASANAVRDEPARSSAPEPGALAASALELAAHDPGALAPGAREPGALAPGAREPSRERASQARTAVPPDPDAERAHAAPAPPAPNERADRQIGRALSDEELAEMRAVARAERLLADDPARALALTRALAAGFPRGHFHEERAYLEVMALHNLGRSAEMRDKAEVFLDAYPAGLYSERVRSALFRRGE